jgi:hypothetical protein
MKGAWPVYIRTSALSLHQMELNLHVSVSKKNNTIFNKSLQVCRAQIKRDKIQTVILSIVYNFPMSVYIENTI